MTGSRFTPRPAQSVHPGQRQSAHFPGESEPIEHTELTGERTADGDSSQFSRLSPFTPPARGTDRDLPPAVDRKLVAAFEAAKNMNVHTDSEGRRYVWSAERGLWLRVGRTPLRMVERDATW